MNETRSIFRSSSPRAEQLIEAWNRRDVAFVLNQFSEKLSLETRSPKIIDPALSLKIYTKDHLAGLLEAYRAMHSRFSLISAAEDSDLIMLTLADAEGDVLIITLGLAADGKIERISTYRSDKTTENEGRS